VLEQRDTCQATLPVHGTPAYGIEGHALQANFMYNVNMTAHAYNNSVT
jgi:hypothetical protein